MAKTKISEFSATAADNTDITNINIAEGCSPANVNNAIRSLMALLKDQQAGTSGDPFTVAGALTASLPWFAVAVYDMIKGAEVTEDYDLMQNGLSWFSKHFPNEYRAKLFQD